MITLRNAFDLKEGGVISLVGAGGKTSLMFRLARELAAEGDPVLATTTTRIMKPTRDEAPHLILAADVEELLKRARPLLGSCGHITAACPREPEQAGKVTGFSPQTIDQLRNSGLFRWIIVEADGAARKPLKAPAAHEPVIPVSSGWVVGVAGLKVLGCTLGPQWVFRHERVAALAGLVEGDAVSVNTLAITMTHAQGVLKSSPPMARVMLFLNAHGCPRGAVLGDEVAMYCRHLSSPWPIERVVVGYAKDSPAILAVHQFG